MFTHRVEATRDRRKSFSRKFTFSHLIFHVRASRNTRGDNERLSHSVPNPFNVGCVLVCESLQSYVRVWFVEQDICVTGVTSVGASEFKDSARETQAPSRRAAATDPRPRSTCLSKECAPLPLRFFDDMLGARLRWRCQSVLAAVIWPRHPH